MKRINPEKTNPVQAISSLTVAYVALVVGLKLDGIIAVSWTLLMAPLWAPIAIILAVLVLACIVWMTLGGVIALLRMARLK